MIYGLIHIDITIVVNYNVITIIIKNIYINNR